MARDIAQTIVRRVTTIDENRSVLEAAMVMTEEFIGSVVVTGSSGICRIFTERDLMLKVVGKRKNPEEVKIKDVMAKDLIRVNPTDSPSSCLELMKKCRCRHLLVFTGEGFIGMVSLRDLVALMIDEKEELIEHLEHYITS